MPTDLPVPEIQKPNQLRAVSRWEEWPTIALFIGCLAVWGGALALPAGWGVLGFCAVTLTLVLHSSLTHEILHGHPFRNTRASAALGVIQPGLFIPYLRFRDLHLAHHHDECLTDPYDDPESNYLDPDRWEEMGALRQFICRINNTLLGRMVIGPAIGLLSFVGGDLRLIRGGNRTVLVQWLAHFPGVALVLWVVSLSAMPIWVYLAACYAALSVLKVRTFAEHRAHARASARTVIIEDRGILGFLFLFNNFHVVHHVHPQTCWYKLPGLYRARRDQFLRRNQGYRFASYRDVFRAHLLRAKDPVPHPLWRGAGGDRLWTDRQDQ